LQLLILLTFAVAQLTSIPADVLPLRPDIHGVCPATLDDDLDSLHSLFSEPNMVCESDFSDADEIRTTGSVSACSIKDISPGGSSDGAGSSAENPLHAMCSRRPNSPDGHCYDRRSCGGRAFCVDSEASEPIPDSNAHCDSTSLSSIPQPRDISSEGSFTLCARTKSPSESTDCEHGESPDFVKVQGGHIPSENTCHDGELLSGTDGPEARVGYFHHCKSQNDMFIQFLCC